MASDRDTIWTIARIAHHLNVPRHRIEYIVDTRRIKPIGTAGIARVFTDSDVDIIEHELNRIEADRRGGHDVC